jgi:DNA/RNA endonuclease G (NUC1)
MPLRFLRLFFCLAASLAAQQARNIFKFGQPACDGQLLDKGYFVICHSPELRIPLWVGEHVTRADVVCDQPTERTDDFRPDPDLEKGRRAELADYRTSGYDRGHQAPAGDYACSDQPDVRERELEGQKDGATIRQLEGIEAEQQGLVLKRNRPSPNEKLRKSAAMSTTFLLSNMAPQKSGFNRGHWRELEVAVRALVAEHGEAWIFTGPILKRPLADLNSRLTIGPHRVEVPSAFWKAVLCAHPDGPDDGHDAHVVAAYGSNQDGAEIDFYPLRTLERWTGLRLFEAAVKLEPWLEIRVSWLRLEADEISTQALRRFGGRK